MKTKSNIVVKLEGAIAFLIPFLTVFTTASFVPNITWAQLLQLTAAAGVAGLSGLKSFLSTTFSNYNDAQPTPDAPAQPTQTKTDKQ